MYTFQKVNSVCNYSVRSKKKYSYVFPSSTFVSHLVTGCGCNWETSGTIRSTDCSSAGKVSPHGPFYFLYLFYLFFVFLCFHSFFCSFFLSFFIHQMVTCCKCKSETSGTNSKGANILVIIGDHIAPACVCKGNSPITEMG